MSNGPWLCTNTLCKVQYNLLMTASDWILFSCGWDETTHWLLLITYRSFLLLSKFNGLELVVNKHQSNICEQMPPFSWEKQPTSLRMQLIQWVCINVRNAADFQRSLPYSSPLVYMSFHYWTRTCPQFQPPSVDPARVVLTIWCPCFIGKCLHWLITDNSYRF